jgi:hypothetical protein
LHLQNVLGALSLARAELHWHFHHLGAPSKSKAGKVPIGEDVPDPTVGALLSVTQQLAAIVKEYRTGGGPFFDRFPPCFSFPFAFLLFSLEDFSC